MGVLVRSGAGRGTRYKLDDLLPSSTNGISQDAVQFGGPLGNQTT
jgi:hypothetical protein